MNLIINDVCVSESLHALQTRKRKNMSFQHVNPGKITRSKEWIKACGSRRGILDLLTSSKNTYGNLVCIFTHMTFLRFLLLWVCVRTRLTMLLHSFFYPICATVLALLERETLL